MVQPLLIWRRRSLLRPWVCNLLAPAKKLSHLILSLSLHQQSPHHRVPTLHHSGLQLNPPELFVAVRSPTSRCSLQMWLLLVDLFLNIDPVRHREDQPRLLQWLPNIHFRETRAWWVRRHTEQVQSQSRKISNMGAISRPPTKFALSTDTMPSIQDTLSHPRSTGRKRSLRMEVKSPTMTVSQESLCSLLQEEGLCKSSSKRARSTAGHHSETKKSSGMMSDASQMVRLSLLTVLIWDTTCLMAKEIDTASTWCASQAIQFENSSRTIWWKIPKKDIHFS